MTYQSRVFLDVDGWWAFHVWDVEDPSRILVKGRSLYRPKSEAIAARHVRDLEGQRMGRTVRARNSKFNTTKSMV